ncbi:MAG: methionyl-tRNA formyltransferase [Acidobacteriota bacterium]
MKIVFMGTPQAAVASLERVIGDGHEVVAVYTQPDRPSGRGNKIAFSPVKQFALDHYLAVFQPSKIRTPDAFEQFRDLNADVAVVVAYGRILPEMFLNAFPLGAINVHFSLLPKYRGAAPVNWAIVHGERTTGVTTMKMDAGLDTGAILLQRETEIGDDETAIDLMETLSSAGAELLSETLAKHGSITARPQDESLASLAPIMKKEDGLISWMLNARDISNRARGFQPFPTAFTFFRGKKLTVWKSTVADMPHQLAHPGEIIEAAGDRLMIFCGGDSALEISELQLEGKRRVSARDFINGVRPGVGELLGT